MYVISLTHVCHLPNTCMSSPQHMYVISPTHVCNLPNTCMSSPQHLYVISPTPFVLKQPHTSHFMLHGQDVAFTVVVLARFIPKHAGLHLSQTNVSWTHLTTEYARNIHQASFQVCSLISQFCVPKSKQGSLFYLLGHRLQRLTLCNVLHTV